MKKDDEKIVIFNYYETSVDAYLIKGILDENNIPCFISNEAFNTLYPIFNDQSGCGITIHLFERDMERARKAVEEQQLNRDDSEALPE